MTTQPNSPARRPGRPPTPVPTFASAVRHGVTRKHLAELCDVPGSTVDAWRRAGCPRTKRGLFVPAQVQRWLLDRERDNARGESPPSPWDEASKKAIALLRLQALSERRRSYVSRDWVRVQWQQRIDEVQRSLVGIPRALRDSLAARLGTGRCSEADIEAAATEVVYEALRAFAAGGSA